MDLALLSWPGMDPWHPPAWHRVGGDLRRVVDLSQPLDRGGLLSCESKEPILLAQT